MRIQAISNYTMPNKSNNINMKGKNANISRTLHHIKNISLAGLLLLSTSCNNGSTEQNNFPTETTENTIETINNADSINQYTKPQKQNILAEMDSLKLFNVTDKKIVSQVLERLKLKDIEYSENNNLTKLYLKFSGYTYNMTLGKVADNIITGIVSKEYEDGKNELFATKLEFIQTNRSNKVQISYMPAVQLGLSDDSEIKQKNLQEASVNINNEGLNKEEVKKWEETYGSSGFHETLFGLLGSGSYSSKGKSPKEIITKEMNNINIALQLSNSDVRKNTTFSVDKQTGKLTHTGAEIGNIIHKSNRPNRPGWSLVEGPHGNMFLTPKSVMITPEGIYCKPVLDLLKCLDGETNSNNFCRTALSNAGIKLSEYKFPEYINSPETLELLIKAATILSNANYRVYGNVTVVAMKPLKDTAPEYKQRLDDFIEVANEIKKAELEYQ